MPRGPQPPEDPLADAGPRDIPLTEALELAVYRDIFLAAPRELAARHGIELAELGGVTLTAVGDLPSNSMLHRAIGLGLGEPADEATLDAACAWFDERDADLYVPVAPHVRPDELPGWLARRGFEPAWAWMKFLRGVEPLPEDGALVHVRQVGAEQAAEFGSLVAAGFSMPAWTGEWLAALVGRRGWTLYVGYDGETAVGAAGLFVDGRAGYMGFGSVLPEHRGKGAQRALLAARIRTAAELGCRTLVTETGARVPGRPDFSYRNIVRVGFEEQYERPNYVRRAVSASRA
jgi:GNAT superfamily N-acetyltransferase